MNRELLTSVTASASNKPPGTSHAFHVLAFTSSEYGRRGRGTVMLRARAGALLQRALAVVVFLVYGSRRAFQTSFPSARVNIKVKGRGQECPRHTGVYCYRHWWDVYRLRVGGGRSA